MDTIVFEALACLRNGKLIIPGPNPNRGAGDPNQMLEEIGSDQAFLHLATSNGLILSPDGRYAAYVNYNNVIMHFEFEYQLIILDVESGEYFYGQTWDVDFFKDDTKCAGVVEAAFDKTSEYLYYITYGDQNEHPCSLYRYTMATGENELLINYEDNVYMPNLTALSPSVLIAPRSSVKTGESHGLMVYADNSTGGWETNEHFLPVSGNTAEILRLQASASSGLALSMVEIQKNLINAFISVVDTQNNFDGLDRMIVFNEDVTSCEVVSYDDFLNSDRFDVMFMINQPELLNAYLTLDGKHALTVHRTGSEYVLNLVNLETLEIKNVEFPGRFEGQRAAFDSPMSNSYPLGVNMLSDTLVVINTQKGPRLFVLK